MLRKSLAGLMTLCLLVPVAWAQPKATPPTVVLRVRSLENVIQSIKTVAKAVDKAEVGEQLDALIKAQVGPKGLDGVDTKRSMGMYLRMGEDLSAISGVLMIPISNEKAFLKLLENVNYPAKKNPGGIYIVQQFDVPFDIGFRIANGYAYVTGLNLDAIDKGSLLPPAKVFPRNITSLLSSTVRMDQVPKVLKDLMISKMEEALQKEKDKVKPGETENERKLRIQFLDTFAEQASDFISGAREINSAFTIDSKTKKIVAETTITSKGNSRLAANIKYLGGTPSIFGGMIKDNTAALMLLNFRLPKKVQTAIFEIADEEIRKKIKEEVNANKRKYAEKFYEALRPSLKAGEIDGAIGFLPTKGTKTTMVGGLRLRNGLKVEKVVKELIGELPFKDAKKIKVDIAKVGKVNVHRVDAQEEYDEDARRLFGESPVYLAFGPKAMYFSVGEEALGAIKNLAKSESGQTPALKFSLTVKDLVPVAAKTEREKAIAKKVFSDKDKGLVDVTIQGGDSLQVRYSFSLSLIRYAIMVGDNPFNEVRKRDNNHRTRAFANR